MKALFSFIAVVSWLGALAQPDEMRGRADDELQISDHPLVTIVEIYHVAAGDQPSLVRSLTNESVLRRLPGFRSTFVLNETVHEVIPGFVEEDGLARVARYIQLEWISNANKDRALSALTAAQKASGQTTEVRTYTVAYSRQRNGSGLSKFKLGNDAAFINEVKINESSEQPTVLQAMIANDRFAETQTAWRSTNLHESEDGLRNLNVGLFSSREDAVRILTSGAAGAPPTSGPLPGSSDLHFYTVVWGAACERDRSIPVPIER